MPLKNKSQRGTVNLVLTLKKVFKLEKTAKKDKKQ